MPNEYLGRNISLGAAAESVRGTPESAPTAWFRILAQNHKDKIDYLNAQGAIGTIVENYHAEPDKEWAEGGFDAEIDAETIGLILLALMGAVETTEVEASEAYLHTFDLVEGANHQSLTLWVNEPNRSVAYPLACLDSLSFSFERGKLLDFSCNMMSQKGADDESTPAFSELKAFRPKDFHFYLADDISGLDSADEVFLKTMNLEFAKNLEPDDVLGLESPQNFLNKVFATSASISFLYTDDTYRALFKAGTPKAARIRIVNPSINLVDAVAAEGTITIVDYTGVSGDTVTIGGTVLTEGVDWNAGGSNNAAATSLASAIDALPNVSASESGAIITVTASTGGVAGNTISLSSSAGADITLSASNLENGEDAIHPYLVFDFARVFFGEYEEDNGRENIKSQTINLTFAVNSEESEIEFGQIRLMNSTDDYTP